MDWHDDQWRVKKSKEEFISGPFVSEPLPKKYEITILPMEPRKSLKLGWVVHEEIGFAVMNEPKKKKKRRQ